MMKLNKKLASIAAGILFLLAVVICATEVIPLLIDRSWESTYDREIAQVTLIINAIGIVVFSFMGFYVLRQKKVSKILMALWSLPITIISVWNSVLKEEYVLPVILFAALILSRTGYGDPNSEAAKVQAQTEKQTSIYDKQLKDGILTQEEYDQITKNMK